MEQVNVDPFKMLNELGMRNVTEELDEVKFSCPFPGHMRGDEEPSAYMNKNTTAWFCHGCKRKGNAITFLADYLNVSNAVSLYHLRQLFGGAFREPETTLLDEVNKYFLQQGKPVNPIAVPTVESWVLSDYKINWDLEYKEYMADRRCFPAYIFERGFNPKALNEFMVGYDKKSNRVTIPVFDREGRLVGMKGRALLPDQKPKYLILGDRGESKRYGFKPYNTSRVVFALDKVPDNINHLIIVEGELNAIAMHQLGYTNTVAVGGSNFTETHANQIKDVCEQVTLFMDSDKAGEAGTKAAMEVLSKHLLVYVMPEHDKDPADLLPAVKPARSYVDNLLSDKRATIDVMIDSFESDIQQRMI